MKLLVTGAWKCSEVQLNTIAKSGFDVVFMRSEQDKIPCDPALIDGVICNGLFLNHCIEQFQNLRFVQTTSAGLERIPLDYCEKHGIVVKNASGVYSIPMSEFAIAGILDLLKKKTYFIENQKNHRWDKCRNIRELYNSNVLIIGCGSVGRECAKRFRGFECKVDGIDIVEKKDTFFDNIYHLDKLETILSQYDIVVLTLPLNDKSRFFFDERKFLKMKEDSIIVNISRGQLIVEKDLLVALKNKLYGAVLDVFEDEPLSSDNKLWDIHNVIITPHNSFVGDGNSERLFNLILTNINNLSRGNK